MSDTNGDHNDWPKPPMGEFAKEHMCHWVEQQKEYWTRWREVVEERSKVDDGLFNQWTKSWMETGFKMLELQRNSWGKAQESRLEHIDTYLEYLNSIELPDCPPDGGGHGKPPK